MPLDALNSREAVLAAIAEFDEIGRDAFLERYGFGPARDVLVVHNGHRYDSKPIVAAAHGHQHPDRGPLRASEFSGGPATIAKLQQLGFDIERLSSSSDGDSRSVGIQLAEFLELYADAKETKFQGSHPAAQTLKDAAGRLRALLPESLRQAIVRASVGQGNWAQVPWIAVLEPRETTTTQKGVYPVLLIPEDLNGVYLTLAQGVTELRNSHGRKDAYELLARTSGALRPRLEHLGVNGFDEGASVDLGGSNLARDYAASVIVSKHYSRAALPNSAIEDDFAHLCKAYADLLESGELNREAPATHEPMVMSVYVGQRAEANFAAGGRRGWWGWRQSYAEMSDVQPGDLILFGFGYSGGSPRVDGLEWAKNSLRRVVVGRIDQVPFRTDEAIMPDELAGSATYPYKIRFTLLGEFEEVPLTDEGGLSSDVVEAQRLSAVRQGAGIVRPVGDSSLLEPFVDSPQPLRSVDEVAGAFSEAVRDSGLRMDERAIGAFISAALTKPFLILTGLSGSGKTQLAKRLGEWCGVDATNRVRYEVIPVRPDWTGPEYLFGFPDALQSRVNGHAVWAVPETLEFLLRAHTAPGMPFVLILDEMNLAHVERYFADFLSGIESREPVLPDLHLVEGKWVEREAGKRVPLPRNVTVVGTVNVDETTYLFSPKVLDRAFTFEFRVGDADLDPHIRRPGAAEAANESLLRSLVGFQQSDEWQFDHPHPELDGLAEDLRELHRLLNPAGLEFGHRVMYEALRFASILHAALGLGRDDALDLIALTKVLPKIHGSRQRVEPVLRRLIEFAEGSGGADVHRLPGTAAKAQRMLDVLLEVQFVSFTE